MAGRRSKPPMIDDHRVAIRQRPFLAFGNIGKSIASHHVAHRSVRLNPRRHAVTSAPFAKRTKKILHHEIGKSLMIIVADVWGFSPCLLP